VRGRPPAREDRPQVQCERDQVVKVELADPRARESGASPLGARPDAGSEAGERAEASGSGLWQGASHSPSEAALIAIPSGLTDRPPRRSDYAHLLSVTPRALGVCTPCGRCLVRARMSIIAAGAKKQCRLCEHISAVANAVATSTISANDEEIAKRLLSRVHVLLLGQRDWARGGQRCGPYDAEGVGASSAAERVEPISSAGAPPDLGNKGGRLQRPTGPVEA
jgi:hypothetical protein